MARNCFFVKTQGFATVAHWTEREWLVAFAIVLIHAEFALASIEGLIPVFSLSPDLHNADDLKKKKGDLLIGMIGTMFSWLCESSWIIMGKANISTLNPISKNVNKQTSPPEYAFAMTLAMSPAYIAIKLCLEKDETVELILSLLQSGIVGISMYWAGEKFSYLKFWCQMTAFFSIVVNVILDVNCVTTISANEYIASSITLLRWITMFTIVVTNRRKPRTRINSNVTPDNETLLGDQSRVEKARNDSICEQINFDGTNTVGLTLEHIPGIIENVDIHSGEIVSEGQELVIMKTLPINSLRIDGENITGQTIGESSSFYSNRSQSGGYEPFVPSPGSSIGASVSMLSSRNSEAGTGDHDELEGSRTILMHVGIADMIADKEIQQRYPGFHLFLLNENPTWFEPAPCNGKTYCVPQKAAAPENHRKLRKEANYEMLDLMFRFYREKYVNAYRKRENKELLEANKKIQVSAVQMFAKAEQEEEYISNNLFKKIQQLSQERDNLAKKYQKDQEVLTEDLIADVAKIPDVHAQETEKLMADKQAEIERLRTICSRTEKNYQEELMRLRSEKVEHESALEQEQELLINTLGKRMSQMTEEKRKMQQTLEQAYLQGFVQYDETVEAALHASSTNKNGNSNSVLPALCARTAESQSFQSRQQFNEADFLHIENKRLAGMYSLEKRRCDESIIQIQKLNSRMAKMEAMMDSVRPECFSPDGTLEGRLNALCCEQCFNNKPTCKKRHGNSPPTAAVRAQPSSSRSVPTPNTENAHPPQQASATAHAAPILATVFPTQRSTPARAERQ